MDEQDVLADRFEAQRTRLRAVAFRMLGSSGDADDAVQETWLRLARTDPRTVDNLPGWLTTVLGRVCLDILRARRTRPDDPVGLDVAAPGGWEPTPRVRPSGPMRSGGRCWSCSTG